MKDADTGILLGLYNKHFLVSWECPTTNAHIAWHAPLPKMKSEVF